MDTTKGPTRARRRHSPTGVPMVRTSFADDGMTPEERREAVRLDWEHMGRMALMSLSPRAQQERGHMLPTTLALTAAMVVLCLVAGWLLTGCGGGSAEPGYHVAGAVRAYTSSGPVDVIVVRPVPAVQR